MKNLVYLLAYASCLQEIFGDGGLLTKFHQNGYKIKDFRMQLMSYDENFLNVLEIKPFKYYNRTTTAHNVTLNLKENLEDKLEVVVQAFKFLSNEYRHFPMRFQVNVKKAYDADVMGLQAVKTCGNFTDFTFYKDITYHFCNFIIDDTKFPPLVPNGKYKMELQFLYLNQELAMLHVFNEIYTPIYPKD